MRTTAIETPTPSLALAAAHGEQLVDADQPPRDSVAPAAALQAPTPSVPGARVATALANAAVCIAEHGATPAQTAAMREITRTVMESADPSGAARQFLDVIEAEKAHVSFAPAHLDGDCIADHTRPLAHPDDDVCEGPQIVLTGPDGDELLRLKLVHWPLDEPRAEFGEGDVIDLAQLDALLDDLEAYQTSAWKMRDRLAVLTGQEPLIPRPAPRTCEVYGWCRKSGDHRDHSAPDVSVPCRKTDEPDYLTANLLHLYGSRPLIGLEGADLNAEEARQEAAKFRRFATRLDSMADQLAAIEAASTDGEVANILTE